MAWPARRHRCLTRSTHTLSRSPVCLIGDVYEGDGATWTHPESIFTPGPLLRCLVLGRVLIPRHLDR
jgi:hypothetical protein